MSKSPFARKTIRLTPQTYLAVAEAAWAKALLMPSFGYGEIAAEMQISMEQATRIVREWQREHAIELVQESIGGTRRMWRANPDFVRIEPLRPRTPEENLWNTMRGLKSFSPIDLASHATTETVTVSPEQAQTYCRSLCEVGYLIVVRPAAPNIAREAIYRLIDVTGPRPPMIRRVAAVVDQNTGETRLLGRGD